LKPMQMKYQARCYRTVMKILTMDRKINIIKISCLMIIVLFVTPYIAFGSEGGEGSGAGGGILSHLLWPTVNFSILAITLFVFLKKPLTDFLANRSAMIERTLKEAKEAKVLAEKAFAEVNLMLKLKREEKDWQVEKAKNTGVQEKLRLIEEGRLMSLRIKETAEKNIAAQLQKAKDVIRAEAVNAAMDLAEQKIKADMTESKQEKIVQDAIKHIASQN